MDINLFKASKATIICICDFQIIGANCDYQIQVGSTGNKT